MPKTPKNGHGIELRGRKEVPPENIERAQDLSSKAQDEEEGNSSGGQSKKPDDGQN